MLDRLGCDGSRIVVMSHGLWKRRHDIASALGGTVAVNPRADVAVGWGRKPSGIRARRWAERRSLGLRILEDGFVCGYRHDLREPVASYTVDDLAPHYELKRGSALFDAIVRRSRSSDDRSVALLDRLRETGLSKWNAQPELAAGDIGVSGPFLLLIDQVQGDLSFQGDDAAFERMIDHARAVADGRRIVVRTHPAAKVAGPLERLCGDAGDVHLLRAPCRLAPLLRDADRVMTVSSHAGFEALIQETHVDCFGSPFYAGWGVTSDHGVARRGRASLPALTGAAYLDCSAWLDLHDRRTVGAEEGMEQVLHVRRARQAFRHSVVTVGMSRWKRKVAAPFLIGPSGRPRHLARGRSLPEGGDVVVWGAEPLEFDVPEGARVVRLEDGPLRSSGLGAAFARPLSLWRAFDEALPFDMRAQNVVERDLREHRPDEAERKRAQRLIEHLRQSRATKYMTIGDGTLPEIAGHRVLVVGQVEDDASLRYGTQDVSTNGDLLRAVRAMRPESTIAYRDHPDVASRLRPGRVEQDLYDIDVTDADLVEAFEWADELHTMTSTAGFEALLRGVHVVTHGCPFYAGWGLTEDRMERPPRGRADLVTLANSVLIRTPSTVHPRSLLPCEPERLLEAIVRARGGNEGIGAKLGLLRGRAKHLLLRALPTPLASRRKR